MRYKKFNKAVIIEFLRSFGIENGRSTEWECQIDDWIVYVPTIDNDPSNQIWAVEILEKRFGESTTLPIAVWSLLHEIGHIQADTKGDTFLRQLFLMTNNYLGYWTMPDELEATQWAVDYKRANEKQIAELAKNFYKNP